MIIKEVQVKTFRVFDAITILINICICIINIYYLKIVHLSCSGIFFVLGLSYYVVPGILRTYGHRVVCMATDVWITLLMVEGESLTEHSTNRVTVLAVEDELLTEHTTNRVKVLMVEGESLTEHSANRVT